MADPVALSRRAWLALLAFGAASGLPYQQLAEALQIWQRKVGWTVEEIALFGWVTLPFTVKVLWAPLVDTWVPPLFGRRRGWIILAQLAAAVGLVGIGLHGPEQGGWPLLLAALLTACAGATQDLAVNAFTIEALDDRTRSTGVGISVWGWRLGALAGGGLAVDLADRSSWTAAYLAAAACMLALAGAGLVAREPQGRTPPADLRTGVVEPIGILWREHGPARLATVLALVLLYKLPDSFAGLAIMPYLTDRFDLMLLGSPRTVTGLLAAGVGVGLAGWLAPRLGETRRLLAGVLVMAFSNLAYVAIARGLLSGGYGLIATVAIDQACNAFAGTLLVAWLMGFCRGSLSATQYALLFAVSALTGHLCRPLAWLQRYLGWEGFFLVSVAAALPALLLITVMWRRRALGLDSP